MQENKSTKLTIIKRLSENDGQIKNKECNLRKSTEKQQIKLSPVSNVQFHTYSQQFCNVFSNNKFNSLLIKTTTCIRHASTLTISFSKIYYIVSRKRLKRLSLVLARLMNLVNEQLSILEFIYNFNLHTIINYIHAQSKIIRMMNLIPQRTL